MTNIEAACLSGALSAIEKAKARLTEKAAMQADPADRTVTERTFIMVTKIEAELRDLQK